ncbi:DEAD/DEAH box helicase family protein [Dehalobacterium formicoaceticum]|uniref:DEAD/DEAH box helicase family protein n=1 Tax=Dehalobacterium formicoaceticum TaxID=51515 RepID=UPI0031F689F8
MANSLRIPDTLVIRDYQKDAIRAWLNAKGRGILEMATGTGKTITSICAIVTLLQQLRAADHACGLVIVLPYKVLLEQWQDNLAEFGIHPLPCYESKAVWLPKLQSQTDLFERGSYKNLSVITTTATFHSDEFQSELEKMKGQFIFCADEVHHLATEQGVSLLPADALFRIGLSATLMTKYENKSMDDLIAYFENGVVYSFSLEKAIGEGFLTPYKYYPIFVELTDDEKEEYFILSKKIAKAYLICENDDNTEILQALLMKRARIISSAENKLEMLRTMGDIIRGSKYNLFYCGDRREAEGRYIEKVNRLLSFNLDMKTHTFTSEENRIERRDILNSFSNGDIEALTAIRCLDEGVDIPALRRAFILSSGTNPKEFIQRRGRILRRSPGKDLAEIYDFFVVPTMQSREINRLDIEQLNSERRIINREFDRFKEFANLAANKQDAYSKIIDIWELYNR